MDVRTYDASEERRVLLSMIFRTEVLESVAHHLDRRDPPFRSRWASLVARWCLEFFDRYSKAPRKSIRLCFERWARNQKDEETIRTMERFLHNLSSELDKIRDVEVEALLHMANRHIERVRLERLASSIQALLEQDEVDKASEMVLSYESVQFGSNGWTNPFEREFILKSLRRESEEDLIVFPGALGDFFRHQLKRGDFVAFAGPEKRGKSYWLLEMVWRALEQRRRVLYYVLGDLPEEEIGARIVARAARRPIHPGIVQIPVRIISKDPMEPRVAVRSRKFDHPISPKEACAAIDAFMDKTAARFSRLQLRREGGGIISASDIESHIRDFVRKEWTPDVVVIDYADLLRPEPKTTHMDLRHQVNATWMILRRIAMDHQCLVITASQTAASSYGSITIRKRDFSEDKRKHAHVTGMVGINQTEAEKDAGLYRLNWVVLRKGRFSESKVVWTAGDLSVSCPCILSSW